MMEKSTVRNSDIEALRILAMLAIIFFHFSYHGIRPFVNESLTLLSPAEVLTWQVFFAHLIGWCGDLGNSLFMLITGYFLIKGKVNWKKNFLLACAMLFYAWCILFYVTNWEMLELSRQQVWDELLPFLRGENWFVSCYLVFSFFIPFINKLLLALTKREYKIFLLLLFLFYSVLPKLGITTYFAGNKLFFFLLVYSIGGYLRLHAKCDAASHTGYRNGFWGLFALMIFSVIFYDVLGVYLTDPYFIKEADSFRKVIPIPLAAMLFGYTVSAGKDLHNTAINRIAGTMLGVYLIHDNSVFRILLWNHFFPNVDYLASVWFPIFTIVKCLSVFVICVVIELLRKSLLEAPFERLLNRYWPGWAAQLSEKMKRIV